MSKIDMAPPALFSVIIPTHDRPALLLRAIGSVLEQALGDFELIVVDDGDGSGVAAAQTRDDARIRTADNGHRGQVPARNHGVALATGRWIAFLDDDDWWADAEHLGAMAAALADQDGLAYGSGRVVIEDGHGPTGEAYGFAARANAQSLRQDNTLLVSSVAFPRGFFSRFGPFDETLPYYWDWDWYLRLAAAGVPLLPALSDAARISARIDSVSSDANNLARQADLERLRAKHGLPPIALKNHLSIARERAAGG